MKHEPLADAYRVFIALSLPREVIDYLVRVQHCLKDRGIRARWVRPKSMHLTLKFLGNTAVEKIDLLAAALESVANCHAPMRLAAKGLGGFPNRRRPRVIWIGIGHGLGRLIDLQKAIDEAMIPLGWPVEKRSFRGHLTIGRVKGRRAIKGNNEAIFARCEPDETVEFPADHLTLFRSQLRPDGALYDRLGQWALRKEA